MKKIMIIAFCAMFFAFCANSKFIPLSNKAYVPINESEVTIFLSEKDLPKEYEKVAIISTNYTSSHDQAKWKSVRKKCAQFGCNGVYQSMERRASSGERIAGAVFGTGSQDKAEFVAIRYTKQQ